MKNILGLLVITLLVGCAFAPHDTVVPSETHYEDGLPIMYIHPKPPSKDEYTDITFTFKGKEYVAEGKIRGSGSLSYPKNNYTLKFSDQDPFTFNDRIKNKKKIVLISNFDDPSYIRQRLAYELWNKLDNTFRVETGNCVVYVNGKYHGLYTVVEKYGEDSIQKLSDLGKVNGGGNFFKAARNEANFYLNDSDSNFPLNSNDLAANFEKKVGYPEAGMEGAYDDLIDLIKSLNSISTEDAYGYLTTKLSIRDFYSWMSFTTFLKATDSAGNNCYYYHDLVTDKWYYAPWDFNVSFGLKQDLTSYVNSGPYLLYEFNKIFNHIWSNKQLLSEYDSYNRGLINNKIYSLDEMEPMIDKLYSEIEEAAEKDSEHWEEEREEHYGGSVETDFEDSVDDLKSWIEGQYELWESYY